MKKLLFILIFTISLFHTSLFSQWVQQSVPVTKPITGIKFIDVNIGWACTEYTGSPNTGYILYTSNGGTNWIIQDSTVNATFGALSLINANVLYCGGYDFSTNSANLKKTTNGGLNWVLIPTPTNMAIADMVFLNQDSGWSCSSNVGADVRTTTNGGLNWIVRTSGILQQTQKLFFLNYNTGFCGANSQLYKTTNAGLNWVLFYSPGATVYSIFFLYEQTGWVGISNNRIRFTSNSGSNWTEQTISPPSGSIRQLHFFNNNTGWAGVNLDYIFKTTNGGVNWGYQSVTTGSKFFCFADTANGWCAGLTGGSISKTTNGGGPITYVGINSISVEIPVSFELYQNYPNPFNPVTNFKIDISENAFVKITIYDILGRIIKTELDDYLRAGTYSVNFNASNLPSGTYFYRLTSNNFNETKKMVLIK